MALGSALGNLALTSSAQRGPPQVPLNGPGESQPLTRAAGCPPGDTEGKYAIHWGGKECLQGSHICMRHTSFRSWIIRHFEGL
ncbi:hypothetical protein E2C01_029867 [Portunus trituberculatus]|uniref:Uncharacterized protein n=1 Tax=Portunus trituberculatus TaxID=210409 RepID=A0A5B7EP06_PORTR|nr:hypothetical protein [Portunus trituberculatus]